MKLLLLSLFRTTKVLDLRLQHGALQLPELDHQEPKEKTKQLQNGNPPICRRCCSSSLPILSPWLPDLPRSSPSHLVTLAFPNHWSGLLTRILMAKIQRNHQVWCVSLCFLKRKSFFEARPVFGGTKRTRVLDSALAFIASRAFCDSETLSAACSFSSHSFPSFSISSEPKDQIGKALEYYNFRKEEVASKMYMGIYVYMPKQIHANQSAIYVKFNRFNQNRKRKMSRQACFAESLRCPWNEAEPAIWHSPPATVRSAQFFFFFLK